MNTVHAFVQFETLFSSPIQVKATLLGALFLIDFMYFEQQQNNNND